ncbi:methionine adenosyltransferase [Candidatus Uhrbacteria bacterium]|nr:MAG: methionine adenosyltransferase [Candidatus Uhrbacteria bacterium]
MFHRPSTYTVESVTSGHPDKVCDQISDAILDACLAQDPTSRVAVECFGGHGLLVIGGEVSTKAEIDAETIARAVYRDIGYDDSALRVQVYLVRQSPDIAQGVDTGGAGDQGIMYGYATDETPELLPVALVEAHRLARELERLRNTDPAYAWLRPDGKTQVTIREGRVTDVLISTQHDAAVSQDAIRGALVPLLRPFERDGSAPVFHVNPTGIFVQGGFEADTGLTGRKLMVDTYGGLAPHGGGAFSGKDATKVDRSAAYQARQAAKWLVAGGHARQALVSVAYAIGRAEPLMLEAIDEASRSHADLVKREFDFRPAAIIERLGLRRPIFRQTAAYGHFGKAGLPWEVV